MSRLSLIWAMTDDGIIGINNSLPWKLPADMRWFRQHTLGKPIVMGRKTFESFGAQPLPDRQNIIISRSNDYKAKGADVAQSIDQAVDLAGDANEIMVIGGASLYEQTLPRADKLYMTLVHSKIDGDANFPKFDINEWKELEKNQFHADEKHAYPYSFHILVRK